MLAIDTNVIVRYLTGDHPAQSAKARALIDANDVFVCTTVLLETEGVLRSIYGYAPARLAKSLADFAGLPRVTLEDLALAASALDRMAKGMDLADALHLLQSEGCEAFMTFDARFARAANHLGGELKVRAL
ncbi:MAG TPA: type II toxin-antitoxin system VapC family toxin [Rhizomicrobium sp.]|jgi:predicted nucleic acid-binding protein